jgi:hypothetical protein
VEIQISKQKVLRIFFFISHFFCCSLCMNFTLKSQEMAIPDFENQNFPGGARPRTPLACAGLRTWLVKFLQLCHWARPMASAFWWRITVTPKSLENHRKKSGFCMTYSVVQLKLADAYVTKTKPQNSPYRSQTSWFFLWFWRNRNSSPKCWRHGPSQCPFERHSPSW